MKYKNAKKGLRVEVKLTGETGTIWSPMRFAVLPFSDNRDDPQISVTMDGAPGQGFRRIYRVSELRLIGKPKDKTRFHVVDTGPLHCEVEKLASADIYQILEQTYGWTMRDGTPIRLMEMSVPHKLNTLALLERRAEKLALGKLLRYGLGEDVPDEVSGSYEDDVANPLRWIRRTPLYREMLRQVNAGIGAKDKPDAERFPPPDYQI